MTGRSRTSPQKQLPPRVSSLERGHNKEPSTEKSFAPNDLSSGGKTKRATREKIVGSHIGPGGIAAESCTTPERESVAGRQRLLTPASISREEDAFNQSLRPPTLKEYVGQRGLVEKLEIALEAAKQRGEPLEHVLFHGPPGLGAESRSLCCARKYNFGPKFRSQSSYKAGGEAGGPVDGCYGRVSGRSPPDALATRRGIGRRTDRGASRLAVRGLADPRTEGGVRNIEG